MRKQIKKYYLEEQGVEQRVEKTEKTEKNRKKQKKNRKKQKKNCNLKINYI